MTKGNNKNKGKSAKSVNPQGISKDAEFAMEPKSTLEDAAKRKNTK
ncbi:small, acid-soluble spore protein L [Rossellomorea sp. AcN35-11]|nr:small, acid-soluble spore protein L [Rossellomorea aquimaris]NMH70449.1 small, acid-soluble spore protein L [Bacillus sp. RO3]WJV28271.1 small, acid-soluble spore protein L [Rossellomorea sp. AcN35-11]